MEKTKSLFQKELNNEPVYNDKYFKTKIKIASFICKFSLQ